MPDASLGSDHQLLRVLLVEDRAAEARLTEELLLRVRKRCYVVEWVTSVDVALERLREREHDVCLSDWHLVSETAADLLSACQDEDLPTPVVVLTGSPDPQVDERALALGATNLISKRRLTPGLLDRTIRYALVRGRAESSLRARAERDELTGLARRERLVRSLERALAEVERGRVWEAAVLYVDLDRFKEINDTLGHGAGDRVLQAVARRMERTLRPRDLLARMGGDEFAVLLQGPRACAAARAAKQRLQEALDNPMVIDGLEISLGASVGLAVTNSGDAYDGNLIDRADQDMYRDKELRRKPTPSLPPMEGPDALVRALERGEFQLEYQPVLDAGTGWVVGLEALVRWAHPKQGVLLPGAFLDVAEQLGFGRLLGDWVLQRSCEDLAAWQHDIGMMVPGLRLNLTADQFADPQLADAIEKTLETHGLRPHQLSLEIGEEVLLGGDTQAIVDRIKAVRSLGVRLCLDGFGSDGLRLDLIAQFPLDEVKLAPQVIEGLEVDPRRAIVIEGLFEICTRLRIEVTAKNVETRAQAEALMKLRCQRQQGYHHHRAMSQDGVLAYLAKQEFASA